MFWQLKRERRKRLRNFLSRKTPENSKKKIKGLLQKCEIKYLRHSQNWIQQRVLNPCSTMNFRPLMRIRLNLQGSLSRISKDLVWGIKRASCHRWRLRLGERRLKRWKWLSLRLDLILRWIYLSKKGVKNSFWRICPRHWKLIKANLRSQAFERALS